MTLGVLFREAARRELDEAALWYDAQRSGLGLEFVSEVDRAVRLASESPTRFSELHSEIRCVRLQRFPYSVFFRSEGHRIVIVAVFHARRDPAVWRERP
jgi:toxin ParE1/3/4